MNFKQHVKYFKGDSAATDYVLARDIQDYAESHNYTIRLISYAVGNYGHALVVFDEYGA